MTVADEMQQRIDIESLQRLDQAPHPLQSPLLVILAHEDERWRRLRSMHLEILNDGNLHIDIAHLTQRTTHFLVAGCHIPFTIATGDCWHQREELANPPRRHSAVMDRGGNAVIDAVQLSSQTGRLFVQ
jgi:hypothetical protein